MRGTDERQGSMFSYVDMESRIPSDHPLRRVLVLVDCALETIRPRLDRMYAAHGRPSIAPERLLVEQIRYDLLFRWFIGLGMDEAVWDATSFGKNRDRLLDTRSRGTFSGR